VNPRRAPLTLGVVVAVAGLVLLVHPSAADLVLLRSTSSDNSLGERVSYTTLGFTVIRHYPLGAGWGAYFRFLGTELVPNPRQLPWYHNDYLQLATEIGVLGLLVFGWIWLAVLRLGLTALRRTRDIYQHAVIAGLFITVVAMLVQAATDQFFWRSDIAPHIWIVAGLLLAAVNLTYNVRPRLSVRPVEVTEEADRTIA
jgi:O-antigen ligase